MCQKAPPVLLSHCFWNIPLTTEVILIKGDRGLCRSECQEIIINRNKKAYFKSVNLNLLVKLNSKQWINYKNKILKDTFRHEKFSDSLPLRSPFLAHRDRGRGDLENEKSNAGLSDGMNPKIKEELRKTTVRASWFTRAEQNESHPWKSQSPR